MSQLKSILGPMRLPFVILPVFCVLLGASVAAWSQDAWNITFTILAMIGAISSHISVNAFNEYFDFKSGVDAQTEKTPFSGGSGTLQAQPNLAQTVLYTAIIASVITTIIGVYFLLMCGWALLPVGLLGLIIVYTYTPFITRNPILCLISPGLGFGTLWVMGTYFVLTGEYTWSAFFASLVPFFLVNDLLLLNQFPDVAADRSAGRKHFPILIGRKSSSIIYGLFLLFTYASLGVGVALGFLPITALLGLGTIFLAIPAAIRARRHAEDIRMLIPAMGMNVLINLLTPLLVAVGLFIARR